MYPLPPAHDEVGHYLARIHSTYGIEALGELAEICMRELAPHQLRDLYRAVDAMPDEGRSTPFLAQSSLRLLVTRRAVPTYETTQITSHARLFSDPAFILNAKVVRLMRPLVEFVRAHSGADHIVVPYLLADGSMVEFMHEIRRRVFAQTP